MIFAHRHCKNKYRHSTGTERTQNVDTFFVHRSRANAGRAAGDATGDAAAGAAGGAAAGPPLGQLYGTLFLPLLEPSSVNAIREQKKKIRNAVVLVAPPRNNNALCFRAKRKQSPATCF